MPREKRMVLNGSPCDANFYEDGPTTVAEAISLGASDCPHRSICNDGGLHPSTGFQCLMQKGVAVARHVIRQGNTIIEEVEGDFRSFFMEFTPPKGYIWSPDRKEFVFITDKEDALRKVAEFATLVIAGKKEAGTPPSDQPTPQDTGMDFEDAVGFATTRDGAIDLSRLQELEGRFGSNGGRGCDVRNGPCSCGAWHH